MTAPALLAGPPVGAVVVVAAVVVFGVVFTALCLLVVVLARFDGRHVAALRAAPPVDR